MWTTIKKLLGIHKDLNALEYPEKKAPKRSGTALDDNVVITKHGLQKVSVEADTIVWDTQAKTTKQVRAVPELLPEDVALIEERNLDIHKAAEIKRVWASGDVSAKVAAGAYRERGFKQSTIAKYYAVFNAVVGKRKK